jgi:hypothetical protein
MAYRVNYRGFQVTCDTAIEVDTLVSRSAPKVEHPGQPLDERKINGAAANGSASKIDLIVTKMQKPQRDLLRQVSSHGQVTRDRLGELTGVTDTHQLSGLLIGISKLAKNAGIQSPVESSYDRENGRGPRVYQYKIAPALEAEVKEVLTRFQ